MKKYSVCIWLFIAPVIFPTGIGEKRGGQPIRSVKSAEMIGITNSVDDLPKVSIGDLVTSKGEKGQKSVEVMVLLSKASLRPVTISYSTKNRTAKAGVDYVAATGSISFEPGEIIKPIRLSIVGEVAADADDETESLVDLEFEVNLNNAIGAIIANAQAIITLIRNFISSSRVGGSEAVYEVEITYVGYTTFSVSADECGIRRNGAVSLTGQLKGKENVASDDDISYSGTLQMFINMDICSVKQLPNGEDRLCGMRVFGSGTVFTELKVQYDSRGGYIQIENKDGRFGRTVDGDCDRAEIDEEWTMVPNKSISSIFNGMELPMLVDRTLRPGTYSETDDEGNITRFTVLRKIR